MTELSVGGRLAWEIALAEARQAGHPYVEREHLLIGLCSLDKAFVPGQLRPPLGERTAHALRPEHDAVADLFQAMKLDPRAVRRALREKLRPGSHPPAGDAPRRSEACEAVFARAAAMRGQSREPVGPVHLFAAALTEADETVVSAFQAAGGDAAALELEARRRLGVTVPAPPSPVPPAPYPPPYPTPYPSPVSATPTLDRYGRDLTAAARAGALAPVIGRERELLRVVRVLSRRTKSNPVLVGEAGVGKTAVVEALAQRIADGKSLSGRRLVELSLASLVAGTQYRGQFEERLLEVIEEARAHPDVILFLDELHTLVGAGSAEGSLDAGNILKPALARGDFACIGATTDAEYRRYIERDAALERRFQPVHVGEPSVEQAREILRGLQPKYEVHHGVVIAPEAIDAAVELTVRYVPGRRLPDKAVDALDEACARARIPRLSTPERRAEAETQLPVTAELVAEVVAEWTGLPLGRLTRDAADQLLDLEETLRRRLVGQDEAVARVAGRIRRARAGLGDPGRPVGVFLFLGPTGVGKTELARALAAALFDSEDRLVRLDMSEFQEPHAVAKLIGAPPGYVGYGDEGQLTGRLRGQPYAVVLLDEIEKAHPEVFDLLLQVFDAGRLTDAQGRTVDARQAVFIMTANLGADRRRLGFDAGAGSPTVAEPEQVLRGYFRPEFVSRIDEAIVFRPLGEESLREIALRRIGALQERLRRERSIDFDLAPDAVALLVRRGRGGARALRRAIERLLEEPLSRALLDGNPRAGGLVRVHAEGDRLRFDAPSDPTGG
jgi:ATP-dependent Clp protease ATP-binding subunit ClpC